jgi:hypothetical protein
VGEGIGGFPVTGKLKQHQGVAKVTNGILPVKDGGLAVFGSGLFKGFPVFLQNPLVFVLASFEVMVVCFPVHFLFPLSGSFIHFSVLNDGSLMRPSGSFPAGL